MRHTFKRRSYLAWQRETALAGHCRRLLKLGI
jgi:hypothetical protein